MIQINPCPFCGNEAIQFYKTVEDLHAIECLECNCLGPMRTEIMEAILDWNKAPQTIVNRTLLASAKDLVKRITLDESQLRETFAYEAHGRQHNFFDEHYLPKIEALNAAIAEAEAA